MRPARLFAAWLLVSFLASGCATLVHGSHDDVLIQTDPPDARVVVVNGGATYQTPASMRLSTGSEYTVLVEKEGYESQTFHIARVFDNWGTAIFGNILWLGPGLIVDVLAGGAFDLEPRQINITLKRTSSTPPDSR